MGGKEHAARKMRERLVGGGVLVVIQNYVFLVETDGWRAFLKQTKRKKHS
jgi:hypothetical protein